jgi:sulfur carrier protein ThiS
MTTGTSTITVSVKLYGDLRKYVKRNAPDAASMSLPAGSTGADLLAAIGVNPEDQVTVGLNGELAERDAVLKDGDEVQLFSPMEGG